MSKLIEAAKVRNFQFIKEKNGISNIEQGMSNVEVHIILRHSVFDIHYSLFSIKSEISCLLYYLFKLSLPHDSFPKQKVQYNAQAGNGQGSRSIWRRRQ